MSNLKECNYEVNLYNMNIHAGIADTYRKCKACGEIIKAGNDLVGVQFYGDYPKYFHVECALDVSRHIRNGHPKHGLSIKEALRVADF